MPDKINQPKNVQIKVAKAQVDFAWRQTFGKDMTDRFTSAQKFVDSECIRLMVPYTPMLNGILMKSDVLGTKIGSGEIVYQNPYARYQYYGKLMVSSITGSAYATKGEKKVLTDVDLIYSTHRHITVEVPFKERISSQSSCLAIISRPRVGSSRKRISGSLIRAIAILTRRL